MTSLNKVLSTKEAYQAIDFQAFSLNDFLPAIEESVALAKENILQISSNAEPPTFENTIVSLEDASSELNRVSEIFFNLNSTNTSDEMQALAQKISPILSEFSNDVSLDPKLFDRIKKVKEGQDLSKLDQEDKQLLDKTFKSFSRNGALLSEDKKELLRDIDNKLSILSLKFGENVLAENNAFELHIENKNELNGLPESLLEAAEQEAKSRKKNGWVFTLDYPSYIPFVTYADSRDLRKKMTIAAGSKAFQENDFNNVKIIFEMVELRHKRAQLLGYQSHAQYVLEERMAEKPSSVQGFLDKIASSARSFAEKELEELKQIANEDGVEDFSRWDSAYYAEKLKMQKYDFDSELLRPYFKLENVIDGVFQVANKLFGLKFVENKEMSKYHEEVMNYLVYDEHDNLKSIFYADFFPRASKRQGAWMTSFRGQYERGSEKQIPIVSNVCNFTKPTETKPSLLTFDEVTTLFHEFGHALHGMLANGKYESLSGTNVYWDFVELPSQILENWCYEKECLDLFAKHYETGESIPQEMIDKIVASSNFNAGIQTLRQVGLGKLDMFWHSESFDPKLSIKEIEKLSTESVNLLPTIEGTSTSASFSHIFNGGYSSGYYSYKWAEVLDADAFEYFKENGIFNQEIGKAFHDHILSKGGTEHPMVLYKRFRGQEPDVKALLKRSGLV